MAKRLPNPTFLRQDQINAAVGGTQREQANLQSVVITLQIRTGHLIKSVCDFYWNYTCEWIRAWTWL